MARAVVMLVCSCDSQLMKSERQRLCPMKSRSAWTNNWNVIFPSKFDVNVTRVKVRG